MTDTDNGTSKRAVADVHPDTIALRNLLATVEPGATVTYEALSAAIGTDVRTRRHCLAAAHRYCLRHHGHVFVTVQKVGLRRVTNGQIADTLAGFSARARRQSARAKAVLAAVDYQALAPEQQRTWDCRATEVAVVATVTSTKAVTAITEQVARAQSSVPPAKMIDRLFR